MILSRFHWAGLATGLLLSCGAISVGCPEFFTAEHLEALTGPRFPTNFVWRGATWHVGAGGLPLRPLPELPTGP